MDLSFLFDKNGKIDVRGLLAAIPVPLFLLLAYNLGILLLVVIKVIDPYGNEVINWSNCIINILLFFYLGYRGTRLYKLGLITSILTSLICFCVLFVTLDYVSYYLSVNNIGGLGEVQSKPSIEGVIELPLPQIIYYKYQEESQLGEVMYNLVYQARLLMGLVASVFFCLIGWFIGYWKEKTV